MPSTGRLEYDMPDDLNENKFNDEFTKKTKQKTKSL